MEVACTGRLPSSPQHDPARKRMLTRPLSDALWEETEWDVADGEISVAPCLADASLEDELQSAVTTTQEVSDAGSISPESDRVPQLPRQPIEVSATCKACKGRHVAHCCGKGRIYRLYHSPSLKTATMAETAVRKRKAVAPSNNGQSCEHHSREDLGKGGSRRFYQCGFSTECTLPSGHRGVCDIPDLGRRGRRCQAPKRLGVNDSWALGSASTWSSEVANLVLVSAQAELSDAIPGPLTPHETGRASTIAAKSGASSALNTSELCTFETGKALGGAPKSARHIEDMTSVLQASRTNTDELRLELLRACEQAAKELVQLQDGTIVFVDGVPITVSRDPGVPAESRASFVFRSEASFTGFRGVQWDPSLRCFIVQASRADPPSFHRGEHTHRCGPTRFNGSFSTVSEAAAHYTACVLPYIARAVRAGWVCPPEVVPSDAEHLCVSMSKDGRSSMTGNGYLRHLVDHKMVHVGLHLGVVWLPMTDAIPEGAISHPKRGQQSSEMLALLPTSQGSPVRPADAPELTSARSSSSPLNGIRFAVDVGLDKSCEIGARELREAAGLFAVFAAFSAWRDAPMGSYTSVEDRC